MAPLREGSAPIPIVPAGLHYEQGPRWRVIARFGAPLFVENRADRPRVVRAVETHVRRSRPLHPPGNRRTIIREMLGEMSKERVNDPLLVSARTYCSRLIAGRARSFSFAARFLPPAVRQDVYALYASLPHRGRSGRSTGYRGSRLGHSKPTGYLVCLAADGCSTRRGSGALCSGPRGAIRTICRCSR